MTFIKIMQTLVTAKNRTDPGSGTVFFTNVWLRLQKQTQIRAGIDSGSVVTSARQYCAQAVCSSKLGTTIHLTNIPEVIISLFICKGFCLPGYLTLMLTVVRRTSKPKWMLLDTYRPSTLTWCISWRGGDVIIKFGVRPSLTTNFNRWRHHPGSWGGRIVH